MRGRSRSSDRVQLPARPCFESLEIRRSQWRENVRLKILNCRLARQISAPLLIVPAKAAHSEGASKSPRRVRPPTSLAPISFSHAARRHREAESRRRGRDAWFEKSAWPAGDGRPLRGQEMDVCQFETRREPITEVDTTAREKKERQPYLGPDEHAGGAQPDASSRPIAGARHRRDDDPRRIGVLNIVIVASVASLFLFGPPGRRDEAATLAPVVAAQSGLEPGSGELPRPGDRPR
jgi:hypothetical protein